MSLLNWYDPVFKHCHGLHVEGMLYDNAGEVWRHLTKVLEGMK